MTQHGWNLVDPSEVTSTPNDYRSYIQHSAAELMVARGMYVAARSGWFSERSACYLASGRPVLAQDTGLGSLLPAGDGLLTFSSLEEAVNGANEVLGNYEYHSRCARELAESHFDSRTALPVLVERVTSTPTKSGVPR
jgi:hypothetical protein